MKSFESMKFRNVEEIDYTQQEECISTVGVNLIIGILEIFISKLLEEIDLEENVT